MNTSLNYANLFTKRIVCDVINVFNNIICADNIIITVIESGLFNIIVVDVTDTLFDLIQFCNVKHCHLEMLKR